MKSDAESEYGVAVDERKIARVREFNERYGCAWGKVERLRENFRQIKQEKKL